MLNEDVLKWIVELDFCGLRECAEDFHAYSEIDDADFKCALLKMRVRYGISIVLL